MRALERIEVSFTLKDWVHEYDIGFLCRDIKIIKLKFILLIEADTSAIFMLKFL